MTGYRPHGYSRYKMPGGCRCVVCTEAASEYSARRYRALRAGTWRPYVKADPVRAHVIALGLSGIGHRRVAALSGLEPSTVKRIKAGTYHNMRPWVAERLLAIKPNPPVRKLQGVDATGTQRRIGARAAMGWTLDQQARELGRTKDGLCRILRQQRVTKRTAGEVAAVYERMSMRPAPDSVVAKRAKLWAARRGYVGPLAWDDDTIDDPAALPDGVAERDPDEVDPVRIRYVCAGRPVAGVTRAERHAAAVRLIAAGATFKETSRRVHLDRRTVHKLLRGAAA